MMFALSRGYSATLIIYSRFSVNHGLAHLTHVDYNKNQPKMVDVSSKLNTLRLAHARVSFVIFIASCLTLCTLGNGNPPKRSLCNVTYIAKF